MKNKFITVSILTLTCLICFVLAFLFFDNSERQEWYSISIVMTYIIPVYLGLYILTLACIGIILRFIKKFELSKFIFKSTLYSLLILGLFYFFLMSKQGNDYNNWKIQTDLEANEKIKKDSIMYQMEIDRLSDLIKDNPENYQYLFERGLLNRTKGYYEESIEDYKKALTINPYDFETNMECGYSYSILDDTISRDYFYKKAVQKNPNCDLAKRRPELLNKE
jgi:tetratricopeptide (TPR) repeat protein